LAVFVEIACFSVSGICVPTGIVSTAFAGAGIVAVLDAAPVAAAGAAASGVWVDCAAAISASNTQMQATLVVIEMKFTEMIFIGKIFIASHLFENSLGYVHTEMHPPER
jgi:hypothetical protein